ncbi:hypothetical protein EYR38_010812 [Pleurotus pulmonarius]|nr:hypothetical protein EYR38_010812 [Pleurotus pulmonarius]
MPYYFVLQSMSIQDGVSDFESCSQGTINPQRLPAEIADQIIGLLDNDETWNELCLPRIFRSLSVDLYKSSIDSALLPLYFMHFTAPRIFQHIASFNFRWSRDMGDPPAWFADALARLTNLRSLSLYSGVASGFPPLPASFASGIATLVAKAPLERLHLAHWDFLHDASDLCRLLVSCSSTLMELSLSECRVRDPEMAADSIGSDANVQPIVQPVVHLGALRKLALMDNIDVSISQLRHLDAPNLRSLTCAYLKDPFHDLSPWIPATMEELTLDVRDYSHRPCFGKSIKPASLTIVLCLSFHQEGEYFSVFSWIEGCLNNLASPHVLRELNIRILNLKAFTHPGFTYPARADYEILHRALERFPALECTNITLNFQLFYIQPSPCGYVAELREVFGTLMDENKVAVSVTFTKWSP